MSGKLFVVGLGFFAELSGINGIIYYSPLLFQAMAHAMLGETPRHRGGVSRFFRCEISGNGPG